MRKWINVPFPEPVNPVKIIAELCYLIDWRSLFNYSTNFLIITFSCRLIFELSVKNDNDNDKFV
jgi:hypothetical protein